MATPFWAIFVAMATTFLTAIANILFKLGSGNLPEITISLIGGFAVYGLAATIFIFLLRKGELSILYPVFSLGYIWVALLAAWLFGERLTFLKLTGVLMIILGVSLLGISRKREKVAVI